MTHEQLVTSALAAHAGLLVAAVAVYAKFGDRTEVTARALQGTDGSLRELRRLIASELAEAIKSTVRDSPTAPAASSLILLTPAYVEPTPSGFDSERFRDTVREFVEGKSACLFDCRDLLKYRKRWMRYAKGLSHVLLAFVAYEALAAGALMFLDKLDVFSFSYLTIVLASVPTAVLAFVALCCALVMQLSHDKIYGIRHRYAEPSP